MINFQGIKGYYIKNNRKYNINYQNDNLALEIGKNPDGTNTMTVIKKYASDNETSKKHLGIKKIVIDEITDKSGLIIKSDDTFNIKNVDGNGETFIENTGKATINVDKLTNTNLFFSDKNNQVFHIKNGDAFLLHSPLNDNELFVKSADNITITNIDGKLNLNAMRAFVGTSGNLDVLF